MVADKMVRTKWYGKMVYGQNGSGQNGSGQNGTDKMVWINVTDKLSINPTPIANMIFFIISASNLIPLAFLYVLITYL